ncbi:MAG: aconitase X catalytic domain-containing protein [Oscillospiraceae bacterium]|jgi:predicted aconitase|nr:aconitase X catalytic domain-containing protein [Oscillospiraceae bacterium]
MKLTPEEQAILEGQQGETMAKVMKTLVLYGDAFGAAEFVPVSGKGHLVTSFGLSVLQPVFDVMEELIAAGLKVEETFTVDPRPLDYENVPCSLLEKLIFSKMMYGAQQPYEAQLQKLGLKSDDSFSCTCYMEDLGNRPGKGDVLSWAESSAVVFANSVLGARCNRNSGIIELFGSLLGRVPEFDLLTDEGRKASWVVEIKTSKKPEAQLLGSAIGMKVMEAVPFIRGMEPYLGTELNDENESYLKDFGAATASNGAVGLYHIANLTPEAKELGESLLLPGAKVYVIDDAELQRVRKSYPNIWKKPDAQPKLCFIGCPHLSLAQLDAWEARFAEELRKQGKTKLALPTVFSAAPEVLEHFARENRTAYNRLFSYGIRLTSICPLMYMNNPLCSKKPVITNSNKLRTYTSARYFTDDEITRIAVKGGF